MMRHCLLKFALAVSLFFLFAGCKKTAATAETSPTPTPAPLFSPTPALIARFQITPPASFDSDKVPSDRPSEFTLTAQSGQVLRVELEDGGREGNLPATVSLQTASGTAVKPITEDYCPNDSLFPLPSNSAYHVLFTPQGARKSVRLTLLEATDPLISAGTKPEQISVDLGAHDKSKAVEAKPLEITCEVGESWPAHILVQSNHFNLRVMQTAGYEELFRQKKHMAVLRASLRPGAKPPDAKDLPYAGSEDAAAVMTARAEFIKGNGWRGWRWLEGQAQDGDYPASDGLGYTFEAITDDGRFFIRARTGISHPDIKRIHPSDVVEQNDTQLRLLLEKSLAAAPPSSFSPNLNDLDAIIRSLKILK